MTGWKGTDEVTTTFGTIQAAQEEAYKAGYRAAATEAATARPQDGKPGSFVNIAFDTGRIAEQQRIIRDLQDDAVISTGLPVEWLERVVRIVEASPKGE